jgi:hypothetical protein
MNSVGGRPRTAGQHSDTLPEQFRDVRARVWRFVFDCYAREKASQGKDPAHKEESDSSDEHDGQT